MKNLLKNFLLSLLLASSLAALSQTTQIVYKKKGNAGFSAIITFTDNTGQKTFSPADFKKSEALYFTILPAPTAKRQYFKESDLTDYFTRISIEQEDNNLMQSSSPKRLANVSGKITSVILSFPKSDFKLYEPFTFVDPVDTTEPVTINEIYYPAYDKYKIVFTEAENILGKKEYIKAFNRLYQLETASQSNPEIKAYSFYNKATTDLAKQAVKNYSDSLYQLFLQKHEAFLKKRNKAHLDSCRSVVQAFHYGFTIFEPYLQLKKDGIPKLKAAIYDIRKKINSKYDADKLMLKQSILALLETGNYSTYKFSLFVDVLNKMLCHTDSLKIIHGIPPLDINTLNNFPDKTKELVSTGWFNEFNNLVELLNDNIKDQDFIFDPDVISHLRQIDTLEKEPYFEIFSAFNSLDTNFQNFYPNMNRAMVKCTDSTLLTKLDMWLVSYQLTYEQIDEQNVFEINKGIRQIDSGQWAVAKNTFNIIKRQLNTTAVPWFYMAKIDFHNNELFSAKAQLDKSLQLYPYYLAPRLLTFQSLFSTKQYAELLTESDTAIRTFNIWYFHFIKAFSLYKLHRNQDCINELLTACIPMNRWDLKEYYLLGDAYLQLKNFEKAKEAYLKTRDIDSYSGSEYFNQKMQYLYNVKNNVEKTRLQKQPDK